MILFCFGTRPEWLKIKPIINKLSKDQYELLFTGQHEDLLEGIEVNYKISIKESENRLDEIISSCLLQFPKGDFESILVQGDTASAFACAIAAFNRRLKIFYLEAGLRSYDTDHPYPEEAYRQMISRISDINFSPTLLSKNNLIQEKVKGEVYITGNTALDNLVHLRSKCEYSNKILITLHRRENHFCMEEWFTELEKLAESNSHIEFIFPMHPNPNVQKFKHILKKVKIINPLSHEDLLNYIIKCKLIISDSGGLQEEGSFFNKKVIVCRKTTERPEGIDTGHLYICSEPKHLKTLFYEVMENYHIDNECPYGDGYSANKVIQYLK